LAVLSISSIVLLIAYSILTSNLKTNNLSVKQMQPRNQAITISQQIDNIMINADSIQTIGNMDGSGNFRNFTAIDNRKTETSQVFLQIHL
jgi:type II secretory pathway component PulJ